MYVGSHDRVWSVDVGVVDGDDEVGNILSLFHERERESCSSFLLFVGMQHFHSIMVGTRKLPLVCRVAPMTVSTNPSSGIERCTLGEGGDATRRICRSTSPCIV